MNLQIVQTRSSAETSTAASVLLRGLIDYAGLFPPASLNMAQSVADCDAYSRGEFSWVLGRFVVPVSRLEEFRITLAGMPPAPREAGITEWHLSVLFGTDAAADVARIREFNAQMAQLSSGRGAVIDSVEVKVGGPEEVRRLSKIIPAEFLTYFEIPLAGCGDGIAAVADRGRRAKIRTGGETADKFPSPANLIEFIRLCAASNVAFKATAGLHHPLRSVHRLTYHADSPSGMMHGFLNVFLAAAFLCQGMEVGTALQLVEEQSPEAFQFDSNGLEWRGYRLRLDELAAIRRDFAFSFGSCSFSEPVDDLRSLHLL